MFHDLSNEEITEDISTHSLKLPRALKLLEGEDDEFQSIVETFWSGVTDTPFAAESDEAFAETLRTDETIGLRRHFFVDSLPIPWWGGLMEEVNAEGEKADEDNQIGEDVQFDAVFEQVRDLVKINVQESAKGARPSWIWHPYFFVEHFLCKGGCKEYVTENENL